MWEASDFTFSLEATLSRAPNNHAGRNGRHLCKSLPFLPASASGGNALAAQTEHEIEASEILIEQCHGMVGDLLRKLIGQNHLAVPVRANLCIKIRGQRTFISATRRISGKRVSRSVGVFPEPKCSRNSSAPPSTANT